MGKLIVMPSSKTTKAAKSKTVKAETVKLKSPKAKALKEQAPARGRIHLVIVQTKVAALHRKAKRVQPIDFSVWAGSPRERTAEYFPTYSAVSKAIQTALRGWVRDWFMQNLEILRRPHFAYSLLVYQCTHPFSGRPTNIFTYEIQQTETVHRAFRSAANRMGGYLRSLNAKSLGWLKREQYYAYRSDEVIHYVYRNPRALYRMLHVETLLMDAILRFTVMDLPAIGMEKSLERLRRTFRVQLHRFSEQFDLSARAEELLRIATGALVEKMNANTEPLPWDEAA